MTQQRILHAAQILWPAFLVAGILEMVVFSWIDPSVIHLGAWQPDAQTTYSLAFFVFWTLISVASYMSHWMMAAPESGIGARQASREARNRPVLHHQH
jgi:hypothetical protein